MKTVTIASLFVALAAAQITVNSNGTITCPASPSDQAYCAGDSLQTNIIVRCVGGVGQPGNCNDNLAGVPPVGVKIFAPCFQSSPTAGDAACSFDGTAYPDNGPPFLISGSSTSSSSPTSSSSVSVPVGTGSPVGTGVVGTGIVSPTGGAGSGSGGSGGGYNATLSGGIPPPTATPTIAVGAASMNRAASLAVVLAIGVWAIAL